MDLLQAIEARHSVRAYENRPIGASAMTALTAEMEKLNEQSGMHMQLVLDDPDCFQGFLAKYGAFVNAKNYIALVGKNEPGLAEKCGYYGEKLVLLAQQLGLNTCWVGGTYQKGKCRATVLKGEKLKLIIVLGYGQTQGKERETKPIEALCTVNGPMPDWFLKGMKAVQLAPTAINQQRFHFTLKNNGVEATALFGPLTKVDLGIAKCHFEIGAGDAVWAFE
jgi:Nitroreductase family.